MSKVLKKRYWATIIYPESVKSNFIELLKSTHLPIAISPLHNLDYDDNGILKKEHYHLLACFNGPVTEHNFKTTVVDLIGAVGCEPISNVRGYFKYLTHANESDKAQYNDKDIVLLNGFNLLDFSEPTRSESAKVKIAIIKLIRDNQFRYYSHLIDYLIDNELFDYFDIASNESYFFANYIKSIAFYKKVE